LTGHDREGRVRAMSVFSDAELAYLAQGKLGRLATIDAAGTSSAPGSFTMRSTTRTSPW
jgi:hypothetical protein